MEELIQELNALCFHKYLFILKHTTKQDFTATQVIFIH